MSELESVVEQLETGELTLGQVPETVRKRRQTEPRLSAGPDRAAEQKVQILLGADLEDFKPEDLGQRRVLKQAVRKLRGGLSTLQAHDQPAQKDLVESQLAG